MKNEFEEIKQTLKNKEFIEEIKKEFDNLESLADFYGKEHSSKDWYFGKSRDGEKLFFALAAFKAFQARKNKEFSSDISKIIQKARFKDRLTYWSAGGAGAVITLLKLWVIDNPSEWLVFGIYTLGFFFMGLAIFLYKQENIKRLEFLNKMVYREEDLFDTDGKITKKMKGGIIDENSVNIVRTLFS